MSAARVALDITGQNISNADTEGYTRQTVGTSSVPPAGNGYLINQIIASTNIGQGVSVADISQIRSAYLDEQYRNQYTDFCKSEYLTQGLTYLENLFDELDDETSLTVSISNFFDALSDFANDPTSEAARTTVQQTAISLSENFNLIYKEMVDLYNDQNSSVRTVASEINQIAGQIASLNKAIADYEVSGETANDLRDKRNLLLDKLSGYADISYTASGSMVSVSIAGETLVEGKTFNRIIITTATEEIQLICQELAALNGDIISSGAITPEQEALRDAYIDELNAISGKIACSVDAADGTVTVDINYLDNMMNAKTDTLVAGSTFTAIAGDAVREYQGAEEEYVLRLGSTRLDMETVGGGELSAHLCLRDEGGTSDSGIPYYISQLDGFARSIAETVNKCMNDGYTFPDKENGYTSINGVDMFEDFGGSYDLITAGNFAVSKAVLESVWNLAASDAEIDLDLSDTQSANNAVALKLADLINTEDYSATLDGLVSHLGVAVASSESTLDTQQSLLASISNQRESISGVSLDEEAVNLIKYQQTYNACSRLITTIDELLDRLINRTGTVGI